MKKLFLSLLFVMAVFALTSCDSLWEHENKEAVEISFTIPQEWLDSFVEEAEAVKQAQSASGAQSLQRASVDTSITANVSIHDAEKGVVIAKQTVNLGENLNQTISLGPLYIVGSTVYVQVELTQYGHLSRFEQSDPRTVVKGMNTFTLDMGDSVLNITKMVADLDGGILTVRPDPNGTDLKTAIDSVDSPSWNFITEIQFIQPADGKIIPDKDLSFLFAGKSGASSVSIKGLEYIETVYVTNMSYMFEDTHWIMELDLSSWDTSSVTTMEGMFSSASGLASLDVSNWDTSKVTNMGSMFRSARGLTSLDVSAWDTSKVTDMSSMFREAEGLTTIDVSGWDTSSVTTMESMFYGASALKSLDVSSWDTSSVTNMSYILGYTSALKTLDVSNWDTSSVTNMDLMFVGTALTSLDLSAWDTSKVTRMEEMFKYTSALKSLDVSGWDTSKVTTMYSMFQEASGITSLDLSDWDTSNVNNMNTMFYDAIALNRLDLSNWNAVNVTAASEMFTGCASLTVGGVIAGEANFSSVLQAQIDPYL